MSRAAAKRVRVKAAIARRFDRRQRSKRYSLRDFCHVLGVTIDPLDGYMFDTGPVPWANATLIISPRHGRTLVHHILTRATPTVLVANSNVEVCYHGKG